eukprot:gene11049-7682_t
MATVHVFVGQCGNQLGASFMDALAEEAAAEGDAAGYSRMISATHFRRPLKPGVGQQGEKLLLPEPRCVLVDMERQVVSGLLHRDKAAEDVADGGHPVPAGAASPPFAAASQHQRCRYSALQSVTRHEGSGNNWAFGYHYQGPSRRRSIEECIRREMEADESSGSAVRNFHVVHSMAGGTGSGVGCLVGEVIKMLQPHATVLHTAVWPFTVGEVATQWFNVCLSLCALRDTADAVQLIFNDEIVDHLARHGSANNTPSAGAAAALHELGLDRINAYLATSMIPLHVPHLLYSVPPPRRDEHKNRIPGTGGVSAAAGVLEAGPRALRQARLEDVVEAVTLDPAMKFFTAASLPRVSTAPGSTAWAGVLTEAARAAHQDFVCRTAFGTTPCLWSMRGPEAASAGLRELQHVLAVEPVERRQPLSMLLLNAGGASDGAHRVHLYGPTPSIGAHAAHAAEQAEGLLRASAYVHHYERYGVSAEDLRDAMGVSYDIAAASVSNAWRILSIYDGTPKTSYNTTAQHRRRVCGIRTSSSCGGRGERRPFAVTVYRLYLLLLHRCLCFLFLLFFIAIILLPVVCIIVFHTVFLVVSIVNLVFSCFSTRSPVNDQLLADTHTASQCTRGILSPTPRIDFPFDRHNSFLIYFPSFFFVVGVGSVFYSSVDPLQPINALLLTPLSLSSTMAARNRHRPITNPAYRTFIPASQGQVTTAADQGSGPAHSPSGPSERRRQPAKAAPVKTIKHSVGELSSEGGVSEASSDRSQPSHRPAAPRHPPTARHPHTRRNSHSAIPSSTPQQQPQGSTPSQQGVVAHHYASVNFRFGSAWFVAPFRCQAGDIVVVEYPAAQSVHMGIVSGVTTVKPPTFYSEGNQDPDYLSEEELALLPPPPAPREDYLASEMGAPVTFMDAEWLLDGSAVTFLVYVYGNVAQVNELADELATREGAEVVFTYPS